MIETCEPSRRVLLLLGQISQNMIVPVIED